MKSVIFVIENHPSTCISRLCFYVGRFFSCIPDISDFTVYVNTFQDLCSASIYYADLIHEKLRKKGYYDEIGQFDVTEQVYSM